MGLGLECFLHLLCALRMDHCVLEAFPCPHLRHRAMYLVSVEQLKHRLLPLSLSIMS